MIVGAGPAGLALGCYLADARIDCLLVEQRHHPRPHVGESLMPATVAILREIGFLPIMESGQFPRSGGVVYHTGDGDPLELDYGEFPQEGVDQDHTYHVDRARFDMLLMKHAEGLGCQIVEGATVDELLLDAGGRATGVRATIGNEEVNLPARVVVDAGGRGTLIGRQLKLRRSLPDLDQFALHAWFGGVDRGPQPTERYTHVFLLPEVRGWAWMAAIDEWITSIGLVAHRDVYRASGLDPEAFFSVSTQRHTALSACLRGAQRLNDLKGEVNYSYRLERVVGDGWLAVGDAAQFIDPVFNSGVCVAMHCARYAAERIQTAVESDDASRTTFLSYEETLFEAADRWNEFVRLFYENPASFTTLARDPQYRSGILRMLQGDIDAGADAVLAAQRVAVLG